ncbi:hypothetical protein HKX48_000417 [Thoreauomyces humboldtii]|nr:hypothetical protein HKX48_000417 [Thoreauomyces humboldtii]
MKEEEIETLGPQFVQVLKETDQAIPEFLQQFVDDEVEDGEEGAELLEEDFDRELPEGYGPLGVPWRFLAPAANAGYDADAWGGVEANAGGGGDEVSADNDGGSGGW